MDCRVAMSTFTVPPRLRVRPGPGPGETLGVGVAAHPGLSTVGSLSTDPRQPPSGCCRGGQDRGRDRLLGSRRPGHPCWTLSGETGTLDVEVTAAPGHTLSDVL